MKARGTLLVARTLHWPFAFEAEIGPPFARAVVDGVVWNPRYAADPAAFTRSAAALAAESAADDANDAIAPDRCAGIVVEAFSTSPGSSAAIETRTVLLSDLGFATLWLCAEPSTVAAAPKRYGGEYRTVPRLGRTIAAMYDAFGAASVYTWSPERGFGCHRLMPPRWLPNAPETLMCCSSVYHRSLQRFCEASIHVTNGRLLYYPFGVPKSA